MHALVYAQDAAQTRAFFRDVLGLPYVDDGDGWLIFKLPPSELGVHPTGHGGGGGPELYLMCDDIEATQAELTGKGVEFTQPVTEVGFGLMTTLRVPGGQDLHLYQPKHRTAYDLGDDASG